MGPLPDQGLAALGMSDAAIHYFVAQEMGCTYPHLRSPHLQGRSWRSRYSTSASHVGWWGFGPTSHLGGGGPREWAYGGDCHSQPELVEGSPLLLEDIWGEGALQRLPPTLGVHEERGVDETLPRPRLIWGGGFHTLDYITSHGRGIDLWGGRHFPPGV